MLIGERIMQIRKEHGLSQEAFGEQLGVSRQAISKWESGQSFPDIDKLIAISKQYNVSVGWLLGTEEQRLEGELTEEQLHMVERITEKYIAAIPKTAETSSVFKKRYVKVLTVIVVAAAIFWGFNLSHKLENIGDRQQSLENSVSYIQSNITNQIGGISNRVEEILKAQNSLLADYSAQYDWDGADLRAGTIPVSAWLVPKTYTPGLTVEFILDDGIQTQTVPGVEGENHSFSMETTCCLTDSITVTAVLRAGQSEQTQILECWTGLFSDTTVSGYTHPNLWAERAEDLLAGRGDMNLVFQSNLENQKGRPEPVSATFRIFVNGEHMQDVDGTSGFPNNYYGFEDYQGFYGLLPMTVIESMQDGDELEIATVIVDRYDRRYVTDLSYFMLQDGRFEYPDGATYDVSDPKWLS